MKIRAVQYSNTIPEELEEIPELLVVSQGQLVKCIILVNVTIDFYDLKKYIIFIIFGEKLKKIKFLNL